MMMIQATLGYYEVLRNTTGDSLGQEPVWSYQGPPVIVVIYPHRFSLPCVVVFGSRQPNCTYPRCVHGMKELAQIPYPTIRVCCHHTPLLHKTRVGEILVHTYIGICLFDPYPGPVSAARPSLHAAPFCPLAKM